MKTKKIKKEIRKEIQKLDKAEVLKGVKKAIVIGIDINDLHKMTGIDMEILEDLWDALDTGEWYTKQEAERLKAS